jgi:plastocyanin
LLLAAPADVRTVERPAATERSPTVTSRKIIPALVAVAAAAPLLAGCGGSDSSASSAPESAGAPAKAASGASGSAVTIRDFKFAPASLTVKSGAKVTVTNDDSTAHTATADDGNSFDTGTLDPGSSQAISVSKPGSYAYHCNIHPFMKGTIVVR